MIFPRGRQRHAACPCGSGNHLAACCLPWEEAFLRLFARLTAFAAKPRIRRLESRAAAVFWITEGPIRPAKVSDACKSLRFLEWFLHDYSPRDGNGPLIGEFADSVTNITSREEVLLSWLLRTPVRAYEVTEVLGARGCLVKDVVAGGEGLIGPLGLPELPIRSDLLICRLVPLGRLTRTGAGVLVLPGASRGEMLAYLRATYQLARLGRHVPLEDFLDGSAHLYHHFFLLRGRGMGARAHETLRRTVFARGQVIYHGTDARRIRVGLDRQQELEPKERPEEGIEYAWVDLERAVVRATVLVRDREVRVRADTYEDLAEARCFVETCLRGLIHPVTEEFEESGVISGATPPPGVSQPRGSAFLKTFLDRWPDIPSPVLDDRTPREAGKSQSGRRRVADLLLGMERDFARQKRLGRAWADITPLREQFVLTP